MRKGKNLQKNIIEVAPELLSREEFSLLTGISIWTLVSWKDKGTLIPAQCGVDKADMYSRDQIQCFRGMLLGF